MWVLLSHTHIQMYGLKSELIPPFLNYFGSSPATAI